MKSAAELAHDEAVRAISYQVGLVDNLRSRVGVLLSAASVVTAFLGGAAVDRPDTSNWAYPAVAAFVLAAALAISILQPRRFTFVLDPVVILSTEGMADDERYRWLACHLAWFYDQNKAAIEGITGTLKPPEEIEHDEDVESIRATFLGRFGVMTRFKVASVLVAVEILLWLVALW